MKTNIIIIIIFFVTVQTTYSQTSIDTYANQQYYLELLNIYDAWDITQGDPNVIVTVVDSPMPDSHPDLAGDRVIQRYGPDVIENKAHGIAIAGIIGADHNSVGIKGIAPNVKFPLVPKLLLEKLSLEALAAHLLPTPNIGQTGNPSDRKPNILSITCNLNVTSSLIDNRTILN
jgi:subtilisin family serine protease